ncbi:hypothetical protein BCV72DRAFT_334511 [Rhizopus microsporus var. microsporus]|uniref:Uncharacterized protein n=1 Tax=Rhizopus microsporus var. microsporus TaxID=86635 RepID=A0A1X0R8X4_RHIZD|nr:hypothetical protein BCV72DRAFT_334511 [Rhizopus microsporus var. microsporus]
MRDLAEAIVSEDDNGGDFNEFGNEFMQDVEESWSFEFPVQGDYDSLDPLNLRNPDYDDWDEANRTRAARDLFICRILYALDYLKGPVKQTVTNFFANKGYIDRNEFPELHLLFSQ